MAKKKQATPLSPEAIDALRASSFTGNTFTLPEGHLDCYAEIKSLMGALGGKWISGKKHMAFADGVDCAALVLAACDRGEIPPSNPLDFFPTPPDVVAEITSHPWLEERINGRIASAEFDGRPLRYLEPNGGSGALAQVMAEKLRPQDELVICEMNPLLAGMLRTRFPQATVVEGDFLDYTDPKGFDVVIMNPPFDGKTYRKHVEHAESMLNKHGVLCSIVPSQFKTHGDDFLFHVAERGEWHDFGADRFENTKTPTTALFIENDPEVKWREKPFETYSSHYAWDATITIGNDGAMLRQLAQARDFEAALDLMKEWASRSLREGNCARMDEAIAREVILTVVKGYDHPALAHLLPKAPQPPGDEAVTMHVLSAPSVPDEVAAPVTKPGPAKAEQGEFLLA